MVNIYSSTTILCLLLSKQEINHTYSSLYYTLKLPWLNIWGTQGLKESDQRAKKNKKKE